MSKFIFYLYLLLYKYLYLCIQICFIKQYYNSTYMYINYIKYDTATFSFSFRNNI